MFHKRNLYLWAILSLLLSQAACQIMGAPIGVVTTPPMSTPIVVVPTTAVEATIDGSVTVEPSATVPTAEATVQPAATTASGSVEPTAVVVLNTTVQYIAALGDVNVRSGPGTGYSIVSSMRANQTAAVMGVSSDNGWWKIQCPAGVTGSCWVTANTQYTKPTTAPVSNPPTAVPTSCTDVATFVADVTVPDNMRYLPNSLFTKTWRVKNSGSCTWDTNYAIVFKNGDRLSTSYDAYALSGQVAPGATVDLSIRMTSPAAAGTYQGNWELRNGKGTRFGVGANGGTPLWVKIIVEAQQTSGRSSISGVAWQDKNLNGALDTNELLPNVSVVLFSGTNCSQLITSIKTDAGGQYTFGYLKAGSYCVIGAGDVAYMAQMNVVLGENQALNNINLAWPIVGNQLGVIAGRIYQDKNQNGSYDNGDVAVGLGREIWLQQGSCDTSGAFVVAAYTRDDGQYAFHEVNPGTYCVALKGANGFEDVATVTAVAGKVVDNINLRTAPASSIAGWFWIDYCFTRVDPSGVTVIEGNCVPDGASYRANGIPDAGEVGLAGVTLKIQNGACATDNAAVLATAVTDSNGQYMFRNLNPGTYCVLMNAAEGGNANLLLPGDWTYPAKGIWYSQVTIAAGEQRTGVNFGWDYQLQ